MQAGEGASVSSDTGSRPEQAAGSDVTEEVDVRTVGAHLIWQLKSPLAPGGEVSLGWGKWRLWEG